MNKDFGKFLLGLCLTAQLVFGQILDPEFDRKRPIEPVKGQRLVCQSNNDPHMVNFWNEPFEYQADIKNKCLHQTNFYKVSASFQPCGAGVTCNCAVKITLPGSGQEAFIDNCGSSPLTTNVVSLSSSPFSFTCPTVNSFNPFDESAWATLPPNNANAFFSCVVTSNGNTYIKTKLSPSNENVIVEIFPAMSSLFVHASYSYTASPTPNRRCLCQNRNDMIGHELNLLDELPNEIDKCKERLLNDCFRILLEFKGLLSPKRIEEIEKLIANCASDIKISGGKVEVGFFQLNEIQNQIKEALLEAYENGSNIDILKKFCECQLSNASSDSVIEICKKILS